MFNEIFTNRVLRSEVYSRKDQLEVKHPVGGSRSAFYCVVLIVLRVIMARNDNERSKKKKNKEVVVALFGSKNGNLQYG